MTPLHKPSTQPPPPAIPTPSHFTSPGLYDPYEQLEDEVKVRINADIARTERDLIMSVYPIRGVFQQMTNMFFKSVIEELKAKGLFHYDPSGEYQRAFINIIRRRTSPWPHDQGPNPTQDSRGDVAIRADSPDHAGIHPNHASKAGSGGGGRGKPRPTQPAKKGRATGS